MSARPKSVVVLEALLQGHDVKLRPDEGPCTFGETPNSLPVLCFRATKYSHYNDTVGEPMLCEDLLRFNDFLQLCDQLEDGYVESLAIDIALNKIKRSDRGT